MIFLKLKQIQLKLCKDKIYNNRVIVLKYRKHVYEILMLYFFIYVYDILVN